MEKLILNEFFEEITATLLQQYLTSHHLWSRNVGFRRWSAPPSTQTFQCLYYTTPIGINYGCYLQSCSASELDPLQLQADQKAKLVQHFRLYLLLLPPFLFVLHLCRYLLMIIADADNLSLLSNIKHYPFIHTPILKSLLLIILLFSPELVRNSIFCRA